MVPLNMATGAPLPEAVWALREDLDGRRGELARQRGRRTFAPPREEQPIAFPDQGLREGAAIRLKRVEIEREDSRR